MLDSASMDALSEILRVIKLDFAIYLVPGSGAGVAPIDGGRALHPVH